MLTTAPSFEHLYRLLPESGDRPAAVVISADEVPQPYHHLLVHTHHMTVTVEDFYRSPVDVRVLACHRNGNEYARKILLALQQGRQIVQFGLVRINLGVCPEPVRNAIVERVFVAAGVRERAVRIYGDTDRTGSAAGDADDALVSADAGVQDRARCLYRNDWVH